jgi:fructose-1,6-bisphosphatase
MKKLLKDYDLKTDFDYYELIVNSVINGNRTQAKEQFKAMPKINRKEFIKHLLIYSDLYDEFTHSDKIMFIDQF